MCIRDRSFERTASKYGLDFALKKDVSVEPPSYLVFFKAVSYTHLLLGDFQLPVPASSQLILRVISALTVAIP